MRWVAHRRHFASGRFDQRDVHPWPLYVSGPWRALGAVLHHMSGRLANLPAQCARTSDRGVSEMTVDRLQCRCGSHLTGGPGLAVGSI